jgi:hypothetical protein
MLILRLLVSKAALFYLNVNHHGLTRFFYSPSKRIVSKCTAEYIIEICLAIWLYYSYMCMQMLQLLLLLLAALDSISQSIDLPHYITSMTLKVNKQIQHAK